MKADLSDQIRALMEHGVSTVPAAAALDRATLARPAGLRARAPRLTVRRVAAASAGVAAVGCASALAVTLLAAPAGQRSAGHHQGSMVLTAAMVRHMASASRLALAHSGRAVISFSSGENGQQLGSGTEDIMFSGQNWNLLMRFPPGQEGAERYVINRVVNGQAYDYFTANHGLTWYHVTGPTAVSSLHIPDPRLLLRELEPTARFVVAGHATVGGTEVTRLRATQPGVLRLTNLPSVAPSGRLTTLTVWVDSRGVVRRMSMTASERQTAFVRIHRDWHGRPAIEQRTETVRGRKVRILETWAANARALTQTEISTVTVTFSDIGKPQVIRAPRHAITVYGRG
jgi:hypothetical protein